MERMDLPKELVVAITNYLGKQPWQSVNDLLAPLCNEIKAYNEKLKHEQEEKTE